MAGKLGLFNSGSIAIMYPRIQYVCRHFNDIGDLMMDTAEPHRRFKWFRKSVRPRLPLDELGVYAYNGYPTPTSSPPVKNFDARRVIESLGFGKAYDTFLSDGTINIDLFSWFWTTPSEPESEIMLGVLIAREFQLYEHHYRKASRADKQGWQRNQLYSITQQVIRQSPLYWIVYVCLRPDHHYRLISYPYYTKNHDPADLVQRRLAGDLLSDGVQLTSNRTGNTTRMPSPFPAAWL